MTSHAGAETIVYSDEASAHERLPNLHDSVTHSASEYVRCDVHTNSVESFWRILKRAHKIIYHKMSLKHLDRYVQESAGRDKLSEVDTLAKMRPVVRELGEERLPYATRKQPNGLPSGARA